MRYPSKHKIFVYHLYKVGPTSSTLVPRCTNVIQMFRVYFQHLEAVTTSRWRVPSTTTSRRGRTCRTGRTRASASRCTSWCARYQRWTPTCFCTSRQDSVAGSVVQWGVQRSGSCTGRASRTPPRPCPTNGWSTSTPSSSRWTPWGPRAEVSTQQIRAFIHAVSMLAQRRRRWANIETALGECPPVCQIQCICHRLVTMSEVPHRMKHHWNW